MSRTIATQPLAVVAVQVADAAEAGVVDEDLDREPQPLDLGREPVALGILGEVGRHRLGAHARRCGELAASSARRSARRATRVRSWPRAASSRAIAAPIPDEAPVTSAAEESEGSGRATRPA